MNRRLLLALLAARLYAQPAAPAVAVAEAAGEARLLPEGTLTELALRTGDLLFAGDRITVDLGSVTVWHCPGGQLMRIEAGASVRVEARRASAIAGRIAAAGPLPFCPVPSIDRAELARPVIYGRQV